MLPWCFMGPICSTRVHSEIHLHYMCKIYSQSVQLFDHISQFLNCWPPKNPKMPPWGTVGRIVFSLCPFPDESADVNKSWCQSVQPFDSFPILLNVWPPKTPKCPPCVSRGNLFGVYPFPDEYAHVCQIWCQSGQPFDSFSGICAQVSSSLSRCTRWLAQKKRQKTIFLHRKSFRPEHADTNVNNFLHSNFLSVLWRARGGINYSVPAFNDWIMYIDLYVHHMRPMKPGVTTAAIRASSATAATTTISANAATRAISATAVTRTSSSTVATRAISATEATRAISINALGRTI